MKHLNSKLILVSVALAMLANFAGAQELKDINNCRQDAGAP
ncbi:MAG: hypothetical protein WAX69_09570 [Victivallales bacterium]